MGGAWTQILIDGIVVDVFEPDNEPRAAEGSALLFLHGHGRITLRENAAWTAALARNSLRAVCPHGQRSWWLDRICPEFHRKFTPLGFLRNQLVSFVRERWNSGPPMIGLTGVSMGGQGALQLAYRHAREFPVVAAVAPLVDLQDWYGQGFPLDNMFETAEEARQSGVILQLHPLAWPRHQLLLCDPTDDIALTGVDRLTMKLSSSGIPHETDLETIHGAHTWQYFNAVADRVVDYIADRLGSVERR